MVGLDYLAPQCSEVVLNLAIEPMKPVVRQLFSELTILGDERSTRGKDLLSPVL